MDKMNIENEIKSIHQKLDMLTEQFTQTQQKQRELQELKNDLSLIGKDIFETAVVELQDVAPYFDTDDLIHLVKKLLRNTRSLTNMLEQVESAGNMFEDIKPLAKQMFDSVLTTLNTLDKKGYFAFFGEASKIVDTVVTSFTVEDVKLLRENIATILLTVRNMTQPEMLSSVNNALSFFKKMDIIIEKDFPTWQLIKKARNPEVRKGMAFMLEFVKNMAKQENNNNNN